MVSTFFVGFLPTGDVHFMQGLRREEDGDYVKRMSGVNAKNPKIMPKSGEKISFSMDPAPPFGFNV